ncbi:MAG TPA: 2-oxoglutarate and iron-dependent oxygenase domain-containing protein, partial [Gammaproteobacteria bacterium]|nr:2-oxoglutarate and iron-dependent oxygenase domain-containing protein [Gammaproteobacteria bacterium]
MPSPIPVIDLAPWFTGNSRHRLALCKRIGQVGHEVGFFYIVNHGVPETATCAYLAALKAFFALPPETKQAIDKHNSPQFRGWEGTGSELTNNRIDYREQIDIGVDREAVANP